MSNAGLNRLRTAVAPTNSGSGVEGKLKMNKKLLHCFPLAALACFLAIAPGNIYATAIITSGSGVVSLSPLTGTLVGVSNACINWMSTNPCPPGATVQDSVSSLDSSVFTSGSTASDTIKDLLATASFPISLFETIQSPLPGGVVNFDLESFVVPGAFGNCTSGAVGNSCNPGGGSPFDFQQISSNQVEVSFALNMLAYTGTLASGSTPYNGGFNTTLSGTINNIPLSMGGIPDTIPNVLNFIAGGGTVTSTWDNQENPVTTATPEPVSFLLLGSGLVGLSLLGRRKRTRQ
jgi:hypothetical protein